MYICTVQIQNIHVENISFLEAKMNTMIEGTFTKIMYATPDFTATGIFIDVLNEMEPQYQNKLERVQLYHKLEQSILSNYVSFFDVRHKNPVYSITNSMQNETCKIHHCTDESASDLIMKISGIWETAREYGIAFKIFNGNRVVVNPTASPSLSK